jgi:hypothetical protein|tara:strand:+ start:174 stop:401 length:228 start_codon:yes stop_codon:yes gene_type:complete
MKGSNLIENPFSKILKIQDQMFQVKRIFPENRINMNCQEWPSLLKEYYHVDTILRANEQLWLCNKIETINYEEKE